MPITPGWKQGPAKLLMQDDGALPRAGQGNSVLLAPGPARLLENAVAPGSTGTSIPFSVLLFPKGSRHTTCSKEGWLE